jgi:hypothetical protein
MASSIHITACLKSSWLTIVIALFVLFLIVAGIIIGLGGNAVVSLPLLIGGVLGVLVLVLSRTSISGRVGGGASDL